MRFPFISGTYQSQSPTANAERTICWYPELIESGTGKNRVVLYPTPGVTAFATLTSTPSRAMFSQNDRVFAVGGTAFDEIASNGTVTNRGTVATDSNPATICSNGDAGHQVFVTSGGHGYIFDLVSNAFTEVLTDGAHVGGFLDGYFVSLNTATATMQLSNLENGLVWDSTMVAQRNTAADRWVSMLISHREIWCFGSQRTDCWYNSGAALFPFVPIPGAFIDQGIVAPWSAAILDNTVFWLGASDQGGSVVYRAEGYTPRRISTHAIEYAFAGYSTISDAIGWAYTDQGHAFYVLSFPTAGATWVYDVATQMWHERPWWNATTSLYEAARAQWHAYAWGKHLVGDRSSGAVSVLSASALTDVAGAAIRRVRQAPHLCTEMEWQFYHRAQLDLEVALATGGVTNPQINLSWSDDSTKTWSTEHAAAAGPAAAYRQRVIWRRLGRSRDRIFRVTAIDAIPWRLIDMYFQLTPGTS
jgi:hypothetical protein